MSTKNTPIAMIRMPAALSSVCLEFWSVEPIPVAVIPSATNISVNDRQKIAAGHRTCESLCWPPRRSVTLTPETADR